MKKQQLMQEIQKKKNSSNQKSPKRLNSEIRFGNDTFKMKQELLNESVLKP